MKLLFFDVETTGVNFWQHGIHEVAGCIEIDGEVVENFCWNMQPDPRAKIELEALQVGGRTMEDLAGYPPSNYVYKLFTKMLAKYVDKFNKKDKFFLVGFNNAAFDDKFLRAWFKQNGDEYFGSWFWANPIDTFVLASHRLMDQRPTMENFKLMTACRQMGIPVDDDKLHRADYDIELTRALYYAVTK